MSVGILLNHARLKSKLPDIYKEIVWLRSTGTQHIDTGYTPNNNTRVVCRISWQQFNNSYWGGFGAGASSTSRTYECYVFSNWVNWNYYNASYGADGSKGYPGTTNTLYKVDTNKNVFNIYLQANLQKTISANTGEFTAPYTMYLFGSHRASSGHGYVTFYGHVYIYDNGILVREFVPCYRISDSVAGMYDLITKTFYTNGGSGSFTKGRDADNEINYNAWKSVAIAGGTAKWENDGVTLTATSADCYTEYTNWNSNQLVPVTRGETVTLSWDEDTNASGNVYIFPNGATSGNVSVNNNTGARSLSYTVPSGITTVSFRFGVSTNGQTISYKNIKMTSDASGEIK